MITPYNILSFAVGLGFGIILSVLLMRFKAWDLEDENIRIKNINKALNSKIKKRYKEQV